MITTPKGNETSFFKTINQNWQKGRSWKEKKTLKVLNKNKKKKKKKK